MAPKASTTSETRVYKGTTSVNGKSYWRHPSRPWVVIRGKVPGLYALLNGPYGAENQTKGYPYGKYVRQGTHTEAVAFLDANGMDINTHDWTRLPGDERLLAEWNRQMALYEEKVNGDPNYLEQLRAEGRALGLTDDSDQPPDEATMLLRLSARMHILEKENEELKAANASQQTMYRKALVEADRMAQKQVLRQFREFQAKEETLKQRIADLEAALASVPALGDPSQLQITDGAAELGGLEQARAPEERRAASAQIACAGGPEMGGREDGPSREEVGGSGVAASEPLRGDNDEVGGTERPERMAGARMNGTQTARFEGEDRSCEGGTSSGGGPEGAGVLSNDEEMLAEIFGGEADGQQAEELVAPQEEGPEPNGQGTVGGHRKSNEQSQGAHRVTTHPESADAAEGDTLRLGSQPAKPSQAGPNAPLDSNPLGAVRTVFRVPQSVRAAEPSALEETGAARTLPTSRAPNSGPTSRPSRPPPATARGNLEDRVVGRVSVRTVQPLQAAATNSRPPIERVNAQEGRPGLNELERPRIAVSTQAQVTVVESVRAVSASGTSPQAENAPRISTPASTNPIDRNLASQASSGEEHVGLSEVSVDRAAGLEGLLQGGVFKSAARHRRKLLMTYKGGKQPAKKQATSAPKKTDYVRQGEEGYVEAGPSEEFGQSQTDCGQSQTDFGRSAAERPGVMIPQPRDGVPETAGGMVSVGVGNARAPFLPAAIVARPLVPTDTAPGTAVGAPVRRPHFPPEVILVTGANPEAQATAAVPQSTPVATAGRAVTTEAPAVTTEAPADATAVVSERLAPGLGIPVGQQGVADGVGHISLQPDGSAEQPLTIPIEEERAPVEEPLQIPVEEERDPRESAVAAPKRVPRKRQSAGEAGGPAPRKRKRKTVGEGAAGADRAGEQEEASGLGPTRASGTEAASSGEAAPGPSGRGVPEGASGGGASRDGPAAETGSGSGEPRRKRVRKPDSRYYNPDGTRKSAEERPPKRPPNPETERVKNKCRYDGCIKYATFGYPTGPGSIRRARCVAHKLPGMLTDKRCHVEGCEKRAHCRFPGKRLTHCTRHAEPGMINVANNARYCKSDGCQKVATLGWEGEKGAISCHTHKQPGMVRTGTHQLCLAPGCKKRFSHAFLGDKRPSFCKRHAQPGMINIRALPKCNQPLCKEAVTHGFQGDKRPSRCRQHTLPGMVDFTGGQHVLGRRAEQGSGMLMLGQL